MKRLLMIQLATVALAGYESDAPAGPDLHRIHVGSRAIERAVNVPTYNVYVGARIEALLTADPAQIPMVAAGMWGDVQATDFPERAEAIARGIDAANSLVVGLQEVAQYRFDPVSDYLGGPLLLRTRKLCRSIIWPSYLLHSRSEGSTTPQWQTPPTRHLIY